MGKAQRGRTTLPPTPCAEPQEAYFFFEMATAAFRPPSATQVECNAPLKRVAIEAGQRADTHTPNALSVAAAMQAHPDRDDVQGDGQALLNLLLRLN